MPLKYKVTVPVLTQLDINNDKVEDAIVDGARKAMRVKGRAKGQNLRGAHKAAATAAQANVDAQMKASRVGGVQHYEEER